MSSFSFPFPRNLSLPLRSLSPRLSLPLPRLISLYLPSSRLRLHGVSTRLMASLERKHRIAEIASSIRVIPDFPKPGVMFQDITTLLLDPKAFGDAVELFVERYRDQRISVVAGIEARGFIFGPPIALAIGAKFVPLRKPKKLPVITYA
ncbi:hypothetical protein IEQ34_002000 [Dendrobium chrysotoxum]|uniref:adenine phosphoribosyltransferase n=1 Tax=Dendrobium chrysotoxum TaxID=161865 RepID=A0AAV7HMQ5_DENCH|nr:hypothetical protein IEQ34_002000 [Dendrobium chrysotoxum]